MLIWCKNKIHVFCVHHVRYTPFNVPVKRAYGAVYVFKLPLNRCCCQWPDAVGNPCRTNHWQPSKARLIKEHYAKVFSLLFGLDGCHVYRFRKRFF